MIKTLLHKDLLLEIRSKETVALFATLSLLLTVISAVGIHSSFLNPEEVRKIFPVLIWLIFIFSSTISISKSFEYEIKNNALEGLFLTGISPWTIFISKLLTNIIIVLAVHLLTIILLASFLTTPILESFHHYAILSSLVVIGYCSLSTLLTPISLSSRLKGLLLPLILLPLLFPILFAALELSSQIMLEGSLDLGSLAFTLLLVFDVIYFTAAINLFSFVVHE
ncbi:MAG: heme exporter protein CcmB [Deltaproteobacteria bacterium]|nr:heme exporter protein CcmB [Deltaproteobacteria bacterium]